MIKKIVCAALTMAVLLTSAVGVFAAEYTTTTAYDTTDSSKIVVTSKVDGVAAGDQLTYLAYKATGEETGPTDTNIAYIDQVTVAAADLTDTDVYTFTYVTGADKIGGTVLQGGIISSTAASVDEDIIPEVPVVGCTVVIGDEEFVIEEDPGDDGYMNIAYGKVPASVKKDGAEVEGWYAIADGFAIPGSLWVEGEITLVVEDATVAENIVIDGAKASATSLVAVATVVGDVDNYGVIFTKDKAFTAKDADAEDLDMASDAAKFYALGKGTDGQFVITVNGTFEGDYSAKAFAAGCDDSEWKDITVK